MIPVGAHYDTCQQSVETIPGSAFLSDVSEDILNRLYN